MNTSLISILEQLPDERRAEGRRHSLVLVLVLTIMSFISQCYGLHAIANFAKRHKREIIELLKVPKDRVPSYSTVRRVLLMVNYQELSEMFKQWIIKNDLLEPDEWISIDGKSIRSTLSDCNTSEQNFISIVTAFTHSRKIALLSKSFENKKISEIPVVEELIKVLGLEGVTFTLDALHSKKNS
jgi:hypothetical protein